MKYTMIVFDWDGTLMDSAAKIVNCFRSAARDVGLAVPTADEVRHIIGLGLQEAITRLFPGAGEPELQRASEAYREYFLERDETSSDLFPGVMEGLQILKSEKFELAVATGKSRRGLDRVMEETGTRELFTATRCVDEAVSKPHPRMLQDILDARSVGPPEALMVGDTTFDLQMATAAGMDALAVSYGAHPVGSLLAETPKACLDSFEEVVEWIRKH